MSDWRTLAQSSKEATRLGQIALAEDLRHQSLNAAALVFGAENASSAISLIELAEFCESKGDQLRSQSFYRQVRLFVLNRSRELREPENC